MSSRVLAHPTNPVEKAWVGIFIAIPILIGSLLMLLPVHLVLLLLLGAAAAGLLVMKPDWCFYLILFTIPFVDRIRVLPVSFSFNELMILFTGIVISAHILIKKERIDLRTQLDPWIALVTAVFFLAGFFSEIGVSKGLLAFFKFFEAVVVYYMAVYFVRTQKITRARILKVLLAAALFQATFGILQSFTGSLGADFQSSRGYLGYLGLGSSVVWHGKGTMGHFNSLGGFLTNMLLVFAPLYYYMARRKKWALAIAGILLLGVITTYSRGSLLALGAGGLFFLSEIQTNHKRKWLTIGALAAIAVPIIWYFANSSYVETLSFNERLLVWQAPVAAITESAKSFWLGSGLSSYEVVAWPYIPANIPMGDYHNWYAHNGYLLMTLELGLIGAIVFFGFMAAQWRRSWWIHKHTHGFNKALALSIGAMLSATFFSNLFDHGISGAYVKILLFLLLGLLYVKPVQAGKKPLAEV